MSSVPLEHAPLSRALWAQLFDIECYCTLIILQHYHSNIAMLSRVKCVPERNGRNITYPVFNLKERLEWDVGGPSRGD